MEIDRQKTEEWKERKAASMPLRPDAWLQEISPHVNARGWLIDRQNVPMESRFAFGKEWRLNGLAAEIVGLNVNAIVAQSSAALFAARGHEQDKSTSL